MTPQPKTPISCPYVNQDGVTCGLPYKHEHSHSNGLLTPTAGRDTWRLNVPIFVIKATDPFACAIIRSWVIMAASFRGPLETVDTPQGKVERRATVSPEKVNGALDRLNEFRNWQTDYHDLVKVPD